MGESVISHEQGLIDREAGALLIFHAGAMADITTARYAVAEGHVDLIGMTRAQIADPYLVQKLMDGNEARIRPCVRLGYCVDRVNQDKTMVCGHNAATGREELQPHIISKAEKQRKVVVIGGGPAGLEAARISAERGHEVVLFEAGDRLGGQLNLASKGTTRRQVASISDWLINEVDHLGVDVRFNHYAEAEEVIAEQPYAVFVATGGWPNALDIPGSQHLTSSWDILSGEVRASGEMLVFDEVGDHAASVCADVLSQAGCQVTLMTPDRAVAHDLGPTNSAVVLRDLAKQKVSFECFLDLKAVEKVNGRLQVTLQHTLTGETSNREYDHVVVENGVVLMDDLYYELKPHSSNLRQLDHVAMLAGESPFVSANAAGGFVLARLGDAVAGRNIHAAVYDALRACKGV